MHDNADVAIWGMLDLQMHFPPRQPLGPKTFGRESNPILCTPGFLQAGFFLFAIITEISWSTASDLLNEDNFKKSSLKIP